MQINNRLWINFGKAGKFDGDYEMIERPRHGYNWFFYFPSAHWNKGRPWRREVVDVTVLWLCFWVVFTLYPRLVHDKENVALIRKKIEEL